MMLAALVLSLVPAATVSTAPAAALSSCDWAQFVADVTVPDGTTYAPGATFTKTWSLKNIGSCTWTTSYSLVFVSGDRMGGPTSVNLPSSVAPGQTVSVSLNNLTVPNTAGHHIGYWQFKNASGVLFGIGSSGNKPWWVEINVSSGGTIEEDAYDFVPNYCSASWYSTAGTLPCPGTDGDSRGFVLQINQPQLENGATNGGGGLITNPQSGYNGDIHGAFPAFRVRSGDHFQSIVNCAFGATSCYVTFRLDYQIGNGPINNLWSFREKYEGLFFNADVDLSSLAGQDVKFILTVLATGSAVGDRALWVNPHIVRAGGTPPTPQPAGCDRAQFVADVTVPDGTVYAPGTGFTKTWRLKNVGTCTWTTSYAMVFDTGDKMNGPDSVSMPRTVAPGDSVDVSVNLTAPNAAASYRGYWKFQNANGVRFGIGSAGTQSWWVDIRVSGTQTGRNFDFGTASSPVVSGYTRVTESTAYSSGGFGWTDTSGLESRDRNAVSDALRRDFVMDSSAARTFKVDLPNATYAVTVTMGDNDFAHDNMIVKANGTTILSDVDTAAGSYSVNTFNVTVSSGSLSLEFSDAGGSDPTWVVNGVSILNGSTPPPAGCDRAQFVADVTVPDGTVYAPGAQFDKIWRLKNVGTCTWTTSYAMVFDSGDKMGGPDSVNMPQTVAPGQTVDVSIILTAPGTAGSYRAYWKFQNANGVRFGLGAGGTKSWWVDIRVSGTAITSTPTATQAVTATPTASPTATTTPSTATPTATQTQTPISTSTSTPTPTATGTDTSGWNTYLNGKYSFSFKFPPGSSIASQSDNLGRVYLPFTAGTNLSQKWVSVAVVEGANPCKSPTAGLVSSSENVTINGIQFLKEIGGEGAAGSTYDATAYSTLKGNACISLSFVLRSANLGNFPTPPPAFDKAAESAVFPIIMSTYANQ